MTNSQIGCTDRIARQIQSGERSEVGVTRSATRIWYLSRRRIRTWIGTENMAAGHFGKRETEMAWLGPRNNTGYLYVLETFVRQHIGEQREHSGKECQGFWVAENLLDLTLPYKLLVFTLLYVPNSSNFHMYVKAQYFRHMKMKFFMDIETGPRLGAAPQPPPLAALCACREFPEVVCRARRESMWRHRSSRSCPRVRQRAGVGWGWRWGRPVRRLLVAACAHEATQ